MVESSGMFAFLPASVFALLMIAAGVGDAMTRRIPNWLTGAVAVAFFPLALGSGMGVASIAQHLVVKLQDRAAPEIVHAVLLFEAHDTMHDVLEEGADVLRGSASLGRVLPRSSGAGGGQVGRRDFSLRLETLPFGAS